MAEILDLLVIGSGVAGLSAAVRAANRSLSVGVLTKGLLDETTTRWAQGGVAAVLKADPDSTDLHLADTLAAGVGLCDVDAVRVLVDEGPDRVLELIGLGAVFDRDPDGDYALAMEGGHSQARVLHAGGAATGWEVERALVAAVGRTAAAIHERSVASDLLVEGGRCVGVRATSADGVDADIRARHVLLATGGAGQLFAVTTNPVAATGDGIAMALRAGAVVADSEFVQFHPTALHAPRMPRPLLSEALRGHGALLRDTTGERFVDELQPRDVVARAMTRRMHELDVEHCWLDATVLDDFAARFPSIHRAVVDAGFDAATDWLPVAPAAHFFCGGPATDLAGSTTVPGLWAAGETACSGVHGANRLASNSLLEGMVFGARVVEAIAAGVEGPSATGVLSRLDTGEVGRVSPPAPVDPDAEVGSARTALQRVMSRDVGVVRSAESLAAAKDAIVALAPADAEERNLATVAAAVVEAATLRTESRGAHTREDHPARDLGWERRVFLTPSH